MTPDPTGAWRTGPYGTTSAARPKRRGIGVARALRSLLMRVRGFVFLFLPRPARFLFLTLRCVWVSASSRINASCEVMSSCAAARRIFTERTRCPLLRWPDPTLENVRKPPRSCSRCGRERVVRMDERGSHPTLSRNYFPSNFRQRRLIVPSLVAYVLPQTAVVLAAPCRGGSGIAHDKSRRQFPPKAAERKREPAAFATASDW